MKLFAALFSLWASVLFAAPSPIPAPTPTPVTPPKAVIHVPPPSPDLRARCQTGGEWKRYGSVEVCEEEKRQDELVAFQQSRLHAAKMAEQSDEKILKDLGFDGKSAPDEDTAAAEAEEANL